MKKGSPAEKGFTIVELVIVVAVLLVVAMGLFQTLITFGLSAKADQTRVDVAYDKQVAITTVETDVAQASSFLPTRDLAMPDPYEHFSVCGTMTCTGTWSASGVQTPGASTNFRVILLQAYSTNINQYDTNRLPVYIGTSGTTQCNAVNKDLNVPLTYDIIYFVSNGTLYKRRLINPLAASATCGDQQYQKLSCPSVETLTAAGISGRDSSCGADDEIVATNVSFFKYAVYTNCAGGSIPIFGSTDNINNITQAKCLNLDMFITRTTGGTSIAGESELRMSSLNAGSLSN